MRTQRLRGWVVGLLTIMIILSLFAITFDNLAIQLLSGLVIGFNTMILANYNDLFKDNER